MKVSDLYEKHIRHLVLNVRDLPRHLAIETSFRTGSSVGNATSACVVTSLPCIH